MSQQSQVGTDSSDAYKGKVMGYKGPQEFMNAITYGNHERATKNQTRERKEAKTRKQQHRHYRR